MKGGLFGSPRDKLTARDQGCGILIDLVVMVRAVPRLTGYVKEIDGLALIHGQLHSPTGAPFHAFLILFQNAKGIEGMGFFWQFDNCVATIARCKNDWAFVFLVSPPPGEDVGWPASRLPR